MENDTFRVWWSARFRPFKVCETAKGDRENNGECFAWNAWLFFTFCLRNNFATTKQHLNRVQFLLHSFRIHRLLFIFSFAEKKKESSSHLAAWVFEWAGQKSLFLHLVFPSSSFPISKKASPEKTKRKYTQKREVGLVMIRPWPLSGRWIFRLFYQLLGRGKERKKIWFACEGKIWGGSQKFFLLLFCGITYLMLICKEYLLYSHLVVIRERNSVSFIAPALIALRIFTRNAQNNWTAFLMNKKRGSNKFPSVYKRETKCFSSWLRGPKNGLSLF